MRPRDQDEELSEGDQRLLQARATAFIFGRECARFRDENRFPEVIALDDMIEALVTELWDQGFGQTEIRTAFENALSGLNSYAAGAEKRF